MSLLHPPKGFLAHLGYFWPLIWVQVLLLCAAVRASYGRGVQYRWGVSPNGRVFLASIDWIPGQKKERVHLQPATHANARLAAACSGRAYAPAYITNPTISAHPGAGRHPGRHAPCSAALDPGFRMDEQHHGNLPLPET